MPRLPSPGAFLWLVALLVALGPALPAMFATDGDAGRHVRVGNEILENRQVPHVDSMSHTRFGEKWVAHEWGAEVAYAAAAQIGGLAGVATLAALLFAGTVLLLYRNVVLLGGTLRSALAIATTGMLLLLVHLLPRPHLITTAFASTLLLLLIQHRRTALSRWIVGIPPLFLVWANCHGGFPAGFALLLLFVADVWIGGRGPAALRQRWTLAAVFAFSVAATMINPVGPALWTYVIGHLGDRLLMDVTQEFQSPDFHAPWGKLLLCVILSVGYLLATRKERIPLLGLAILLGTLGATLVAARHISLFAVLGLPWLAFLFTGSSGDPDRNPSAWPGHPRSTDHDSMSSLTSPLLPVVAALVLLFLANGPSAQRARYDPSRFPVQAMGALDRSQLDGGVFNQMEWGGYLLYEYPDIPVFIDGQTDFYGEELVREYFVAHLGEPGWQEVLDRYDVQWTILRHGAALNRLLAMSPDWDLVLADEVATVYGRKEIRTERHAPRLP